MGTPWGHGIPGNYNSCSKISASLKPLSLCFSPKPVTISIEGYNYVVSLIACLKQDLRGFNGRFEGEGRERKKKGRIITEEM